MEAELHPVLMSLGAVGLAGICKALLMVLFTLAFLLLFYSCDLLPQLVGKLVLCEEPLPGRWGC